MVPSPAPATPSPASTGEAAQETPFFFENGDRPLYAVFHAPRRDRADAPALVYVHSAGVEQLTNYRNQVLLARAAAGCGFPVLRYHARGHGDSGGDFADVTLESLADDAVAAAATACALSGASRVAWLGERLGALAAARALPQGPPAAGLALWEPVHRPLDYFRTMLRGMLFSQVAKGENPAETVDQMLERLGAEGQVDVHGYHLHRTLVESLREVDLGTLLAGWNGRSFLAQVQGRAKLSPANAALAATLEARGLPATTLLVDEEPGWHFISNPAWESDALIQGTVEWLDALA